MECRRQYRKDNIADLERVIALKTKLGKATESEKLKLIELLSTEDLALRYWRNTTTLLSDQQPCLRPDADMFNMVQDPDRSNPACETSISHI